MANRRLREAGMHPLSGFILAVAAFVLISVYAFQKTGFAAYLALLVCISFFFKLSEKNRTDFLHITFGDKKKKQIRIIENIAVAIPFLAILLFNHSFYESAFLLLSAVVSAAFSFQTGFNAAIPTPFSKRPFEFATGFRNTFFIFPAAYILTLIAVRVGNFYLGIFSMLLIFLTSLGFYTRLENEYYIWVHSDRPALFLLKKIRIATLHILLLDAPVLLCLLFYYPGESWQVLAFFTIGMLFLWTIILAKYSAYPRTMNLPESLLIAFCLYFPPLLLALLPYFYFRSVNKLKVILNDKN